MTQSTISNPQSKIPRYTMFALLYFAQGAVLSFFTALNALYLTSRGVSMSQVGIMGTIAMLPFILKIFLGMLSDKVNLLGWGHRKPYIVIGLLVQALCLLVIIPVDPGRSFGVYVLVAFVLQTGMALYDTCTDGLALDTTPQEEEGTIQGLMVGGRALGVVIVAGLLGLVVDRLSWSAVFIGLALLTLIPLPLVLRIREGQRPARAAFDWKAFGAFKRWPIVALALLGALYSLITNGVNQLVNPDLQLKFNISFTQAGFMTAVWGLGVVAGSLAGGRLTDTIGQRKSVLGAAAVSLLAVLGLAAMPSLGAAWALVALFGLAYGFYETVYFAVSMRATDPRIAASMFALLMAVANIGTGIGLALSGTLVDAIGYPLTFVFLAGLNLLVLPLVNGVFRHQVSGVRS